MKSAKNNVGQQLAALSGMGVGALRQKYLEVFGEPSRSGNKAYLFKKLAWRIQSIAEGGLSERARRRAAELANDADVCLMPPKPKSVPPPPEAAGRRRVVRAPVKADPRLPAPGTALVRRYKGQTYRVVVRDDGLEYAGKRYKTTER